MVLASGLRLCPCPRDVPPGGVAGTQIRLEMSVPQHHSLLFTASLPRQRPCHPASGAEPPNSAPRFSSGLAMRPAMHSLVSPHNDTWKPLMTCWSRPAVGGRQTIFSNSEGRAIVMPSTPSNGHGRRPLLRGLYRSGRVSCWINSGTSLERWLPEIAPLRAPTLNLWQRMSSMPSSCFWCPASSQEPWLYQRLSPPSLTVQSSDADRL